MPNILGINISSLNKSQLWDKLLSLIKDGQSHYLVTPNPEIILASHQDEELFYILNQADLAPADGFGLSLAARLQGEKITRWSGADLLTPMLSSAEKNKWPILILNWGRGLSSKEAIEKSLRAKFPDLKYLILDLERKWPDWRLPDELKGRIKNFSPRLLFCTFGSPYQEKIIYHNFRNFPGLSLSVGIGGAFDFLSGQVKRAPEQLRRLGLEWLWRLWQQPQRWPRIYRATCVFAFKVLKNRYLNPFLYRPSVSCFIYKKESDGLKVLLVERRDSRGHWQLPQGGTDGESLKQAGRREIREELNITQLESERVFPNIYRYDFPAQELSGQTIKRFIYNYRGQKQSLYIALFTGQDEEIKINFWDHRAWKWVKVEELLTVVHPLRRPGAEICLKKFYSLKP